LAESDCERCRAGVVSQPVNTLSSLAYVAVGADLLRRREPDRAFAWAVIGVGVGSVAYHGPGGVAGRWLHDATLLSMLGLLVASDLTVHDGRRLPRRVVAGVVAGASALAHPSTSDRTQLAVGAGALAAETRRIVRGNRRREPAVSGPLLASGLALHVLGRTGRPWCRPESIVQPHAAWHVLSAAALWTRNRF
jgi:hypothetical protein